MLRPLSLWLVGATGLALALELLFRVLPVSSSTETAYYADPLILNYPPHHRWTTSTGWDLRNAQTLEANNLGYVASRDFERNEQAVALIGDSFVEASMLATTDRPGAQLERALGSRPVFAMGAPGTALLDYGERIRFAHMQFGVRDFVVVMERGDVEQSLCGSANTHGPCLDPRTFAPRVETLAPPGIEKRIFRHSALAQYLVSQLKFSPRKLREQAFPAIKAVTASSPDTRRGSLAVPAEDPKAFVDNVTNTFFDRIKNHVTGKLVIVIDCDRSALYRGQLKPDASRDRFIQLARAAGAIVIDTEPLFKAHLAASSLKLDVGPYDGHFNALGVELVTRAAADALTHP